MFADERDKHGFDDEKGTEQHGDKGLVVWRRLSGIISLEAVCLGDDLGMCAGTLPPSLYLAQIGELLGIRCDRYVGRD